jgi:hypothetical protein
MHLTGPCAPTDTLLVLLLLLLLDGPSSGLGKTVTAMSLVLKTLGSTATAPAGAQVSACLLR